MCGKKLYCENHFCQKSCHTGPCDTCNVLNATTCPCGKRSLTEEELSNRTSCTQPIPTCDQLCGKYLECGPPGKQYRLVMGMIELIIVNIFDHQMINEDNFKKNRINYSNYFHYLNDI